jgi:hypothetical protein
VLGKSEEPAPVCTPAEGLLDELPDDSTPLAPVVGEGDDPVDLDPVSPGITGLIPVAPEDDTVGVEPEPE